MSEDFVRDRDLGDEDGCAALTRTDESDEVVLREMLRRTQNTLNATSQRVVNLLGVIEAIEWEGHPDHYWCPACKQSKVAGHMDACPIGRALGRVREPAFCPIGGGC